MKAAAKTPEEIKAADNYELGAYRTLILNDLFFIVQFVIAVPPYDEQGRPFCNSPFVVERCWEVQEGPEGGTLDLWARGHFKSVLLTQGRCVQRILKYPDKCSMIVSATRPLAKKHFRSIMLLLEQSDLLKKVFPDILYQNPRNDSPKWSEDDGIIVKRKNNARKEATLEAWGIKEGMPIGVHFDWIILDDLETKDDVTNPEVVSKVRSSFDLTKDLLTVDGKISIVGTPYSHNGIYIPFVRDKVRANGEPAYIFRRYPATVDGLPNGKAVFLPQETLDDIRSEKGDYEYFCQQLIDPTPVGVRKLDGSKIVEVDPRKIPRTLLKFMAIDPAGDDKDGTGDDWAFAVIGIDPKMDDIGASDIYILDLVATPMREEEAPEEIARMYHAEWVHPTGGSGEGWYLYCRDSRSEHPQEVWEVHLSG